MLSRPSWPILTLLICYRLLWLDYSTILLAMPSSMNVRCLKRRYGWLIFIYTCRHKCSQHGHWKDHVYPRYK
jgi:hypothetical protein